MLSVIMPVFNEEKYISQAIDSIICQTYSNFEFIIINDGSSDSSIDIIKSYNDKRIRVIDNGENIGISQSLNKGINISQGEYIARMDANDIATQNRFEMQINYLENNEVTLVGTHHDIINENSVVIGQASQRYFEPDQTKSYLAFYNICHASLMVKSDTLPQIEKIYRPIMAEDFDLYQRLSLKYNFAVLPDRLMQIRILENGLSGNWPLMEDAVNKLRIQQLKQIDLSPTKEQKQIHSKLINRHYDALKKEKLSSVFNWIHTVITANKKLRFFPEPYFNEEWYIRLTKILKSRKHKRIIDFYRYNKIASLIGKKRSLPDLIYIYYRS